MKLNRSGQRRQKRKKAALVRAPPGPAKITISHPPLTHASSNGEGWGGKGKKKKRDWPVSAGKLTTGQKVLVRESWAEIRAGD